MGRGLCVCAGWHRNQVIDDLQRRASWRLIP
jgi:hypothetical protein